MSSFNFFIAQITVAWDVPAFGDPTSKTVFRAFFVTPKPKHVNSLPQSLTNLAAHRIADGIIGENPPVAVDGHPLLVGIPEHLQKIVHTFVSDDRTEKAAISTHQRRVGEFHYGMTGKGVQN